MPKPEPHKIFHHIVPSPPPGNFGGERTSRRSVKPKLDFGARPHTVATLTMERSIMNIAKVLARKARQALQATKSYFGFGPDNAGPFDEEEAHRAAADAGQARARIKAVFDY